MSIPVVAELAEIPWTELSSEDKRERLLAAAARVFAERGIDAPMLEVADAAGAGVASVYRCLPSKHELLAALVARRMRELERAADAAIAGPGDRWSALTGLIASLAGAQAADSFLGEARGTVAGHPEVIERSARATAALERLLAQARDEGRLRADATATDLRLIFAATRAAKQIEPDSWPRMLALLLDGLERR